LILTGTQEERERFGHSLIDALPHAHSLMGKISLNELISFIAACDGLIAASTGPLHIAAATGIFALGLYSPVKKYHPNRWGPVGKNIKVLLTEKSCPNCLTEISCDCMQALSVERVHAVVEGMRDKD